jgi:hypothetical protein
MVCLHWAIYFFTDWASGSTVMLVKAEKGPTLQTRRISKVATLAVLGASSSNPRIKRRGILLFATLYFDTLQFALIYFYLYYLPLFTLTLYYLPF